MHKNSSQASCKCNFRTRRLLLTT